MTQTTETVAAPPLAPLFASLAKAHADMGGSVTKDRTNPHFHSSYATLAAVLQVATPALSAHGLVLVQYREGNELVTRLAHESGAELRTTYPLKPRQDTEQGWGSAITYARRYQAMALLGLAPADEDDGQAASSGPQHDRGRSRGRKAEPKQGSGTKAKAKPEAQKADTDPRVMQAWLRLLALCDGSKDTATPVWKALRADAELGTVDALVARLDAYTACRSYLTVTKGRGDTSAAITKQVHEDTTEGWKERAAKLAKHVGELHPSEVESLVADVKPPAAGGQQHDITVGPGVPLTEEDIVRTWCPSPPGGHLVDHHTDAQGREVYVVEIYGSD